MREKPDLILIRMRAEARREVRALDDADLAASLVRCKRLVLMAEEDGTPDWIAERDTVCLEAAEAEGTWRRQAAGKGGPKVSATDWRERAERVKDRADLLEMVSREIPLIQRGPDFWGLCPFHVEHDPSFKVSPERGTFKCFGCALGGDVFDWLELTQGMDFAQAMRHLDPADRAKRPKGAIAGMKVPRVR